MVMDIVNAQGQLIEAVLPRGVKSKDGRRPHQDYRAVVNGIFWFAAPERMGKTFLPAARLAKPATAVSKTEKEPVCGIPYFGLSPFKTKRPLWYHRMFHRRHFCKCKRALVLERRNVVKGQRSWQLQTLLVFLSLYGPEQPADTNSNTFRIRFRLA